MEVQFIYHSAYLVELTGSYLLFDYYQGELPELDPDKPFYIFSSHRHYDHFSAVIFQLAKKYPKCIYILSEDIPEGVVSQSLEELGEEPKIYRVSPGGWLIPENRGEKKSSIEVEVFDSTDVGVSFLVKAEGLRIFHAGDLNDWAWVNVPRSRSDAMHDHFIRAVEEIRKAVEGRTKDGYLLDVLFQPMDPVLGEAVFQGPVEFLRRIPVRHMFPMHMWEQYSIGEKFLRQYPEYQSCFHPVTKPGEVFDL